MKKIIVIYIVAGLTLFAYTQNSLYDVNYDSAEASPVYDHEMEWFQRQFLEYEETIRFLENKILQEQKEKYEAKYLEEKNKHAAEIEQLALENERKIKEAINSTRNQIYTSEIDSLRGQEFDRLTQEITENVSKELTKVYEAKKNSEVLEEKQKLEKEFEEKFEYDKIILTKELSKEIAKQNRSTTKRVYAVCICFIFVLCILFIIWMYRLNLKRKKQKDTIYRISEQYFDRLKEFRGDKAFFDAELKRYSEDEKEIYEKAFDIAVNKYELTKNDKPFAVLQSEIKNLLPTKLFDIWNGNNGDKEIKQGLCGKFNTNIREYIQIFSEAENSLSRRTETEKTQVRDLLNIVAQQVFTISKQIEGLMSNEKPELVHELKRIASQYKWLYKTYGRKK